MADDGEKALKLAKHLEARLAALEKKFADQVKKSEAWEKTQSDWIEKIDKKLTKAVNDLAKDVAALGKADVDNFTRLDKKMVDLNNTQASEMKQIIAWVQKNFSTKGIFG